MKWKGILGLCIILSPICVVGMWIYGPIEVLQTIGGIIAIAIALVIWVYGLGLLYEG